MRLQGGTALGRGPEAVPLALGAIQRERLLVRDADVADAGADIDVAARAERLQIGLDAGILSERLDERADRVLRHRPHLVRHLRIARRRETGVEPSAIR